MGRKKQRRMAKQAHRKKGRRKATQPENGFDGPVSGQSTALHQAMAFHQSGQLPPAEKLYRKFLEGDRDHPEALNMLGVLLLQAGRFDDAVAPIERAIAIEPANADALFNLGLAERQRGRLRSALRAFQQAVHVNPSFAGAHNNLGNVQRELGQYEPALEAYERAADIEPDRADIHCNLGHVQMKLGKLENARHSLENALALDPGHADAHFTLGKLYALTDNLEAATESFRQTIACNPQESRAHLELGTALVQLGRIDDARDIYRHLLEISPTYTQAHFLLAKTKKFAAGDAEIETMEALFDRLPPDDEKRIHLGFALAKAWDDIGVTEKAFACLEEANGLKRKTFRYEPDREERHFEKIAEIFDDGLFGETGAKDLPRHAPIFVLGMPRSGTTLVEQILASHSKVFGAGERENLFRLAAAINYPEGVVDCTTPMLKELGESYVDSLRDLAPQAERFTDKTPLNFIYVGLIRLCLPEAKIMHCVRNPMDNCLSCYMELFESGQNYSYDLRELGRYYRSYHRLMEVWKGALSGFIFDLAYEDLIAHPEVEIKKMLSFVGLPWEDNCLNFHATERPVRTASAFQVRQPIYKTSVRRWKRYENHLGPLIDALGPLAGDG